MIMGKKIQIVALMLTISVTFMAVMAGCSKEQTSRLDHVPPAPEIVSQLEQPEEAGASFFPDATSLSEVDIQSLEQISAKDGEKYLDALKLQDTKVLSLLMAPAEDEYTEADMEKVLEGFLLYFDNLEKLQLRYEANEQNDEYYVEHYTIVGAKDGKSRAIPFQMKYAKSQGMEKILDDNWREPLYDSPLIGEYPFTALQVERYVQALLQLDTESLALHLAMYDDNEGTKTAVKRLLQKYEESLDLNSVKIISKGYNEQEDQYFYELRDSNKQTHELRLDRGKLRIVDEWVTVQATDK